jgi:hypothetical protein
LASAFRPRHDRKQRPAIPKRVELGTRFRVKNRCGAAWILLQLQRLSSFERF